LEDLELYYFDKADHVDKRDTITASFENFTTDDLDSGGRILANGGSLYDDTIPDSVDNYEGLFHFDELSNNRIYFQINSSDFIEEEGTGNEGLNGNIGSEGELISISTSFGWNNIIYKIFASEPIVPSYTSDGVLVQTPGKVWLANTLDDPEYGADWHVGLGMIIGHTGTWSVAREQWTDADITINKAVFWERDGIAPEDT
jgi:hypothetical protein